VFTSVNYDTYEITVNDASKKIDVDFKPNTTLGTEVVVAATRTPTRILESPVTIERLSGATLRSVPAPSVYEGLANLKGVDIHVASLTFKTVTTRGFVSSGNTRLNQLVDGMDNQAPGLNFSVSTIVGLADVDVDNIELLSGASSALYGSGGMNGTVLVSSKNPFKYQGLSFNVKQGIMHVDNRQRAAAPYYNWSFRWAKAFNDKLAFKVTAELLKGSDWQADDYRNKQQIGILSTVAGGNRGNDPAFNGINLYGDETTVNIGLLAPLIRDGITGGVLAATGGTVNLINSANGYFAAMGNPLYPTTAQTNGFVGLFPASLQPTVGFFLPFYLGVKNNYFAPNTNVSRTGYEEKALVDYNTLNVKVNGGLHWKITNTVEASWNSYFGTGTTVYTGANRYSLRNFKIGQHRLEFKGKTWSLRGYTTQENSGESYIADALGAFINEAWKPSVNNANLSGSWFPQYIYAFSEGRRTSGSGVSDAQLHLAARNAADVGRLIPGTAAFDAAAQAIKGLPINQAGGSKFQDKSALYAVDAQLNLSDAAGFSDKLEIIAGLQWKQWVLNSKGTIFDDKYGAIRVNETGGFVQLKKKLLKDVLTLTASGRYDVQTNYNGKFTPRLTAVVRVAKDNNIRLSFQTAYRFPSNQNQYINLRLGGGNSFLIGSLPYFQDLYRLSTTLPGYTAQSVLAYRSGAIGDSGRLVQAVYEPLKPETVNSYEIGYRGVVGKKLLVDGYLYFSQYKNFILSTAVVQSIAGNKYELYSPFSNNNLSYNQNSHSTVKSIGWGIGLEYQLIQRFILYGNLFSDQLKGVPAGEVTFFNAPKYRFNIGLRNENVSHNVGFNVVVKWQDNNYYEGTFVSGTLPYFAWVDGQITYRPPHTKSTWRVGGTNLGNSYYRTGFGSPAAGGVYYISYGYNLF
jgi:outer membrane receptor protein involved in Fe transport